MAIGDRKVKVTYGRETVPPPSTWTLTTWVPCVINDCQNWPQQQDSCSLLTSVILAVVLTVPYLMVPFTSQ